MGYSHIVCEDVEPGWRLGVPKKLACQLDLWKIKMPAATEIYDEIISVLTSEEKSLSTRFHRIEDKQNFMIRRGALRILLAQYLNKSPGKLNFIQGKNKKPELKGFTGIHFSVSHSGDMALIGISDQEHGVDIEEVKESLEIDELFPYCFNRHEVTFITNSENSKREFYKLWTRKEALIKATTTGLNNNLARIPVLDGCNQVDADLLQSPENWLVTSFKLEYSYYASVVKSNPDSIINFYNFYPPSAKKHL